jgi:predicted transposase YbfD/YdcC
MSAPESSPASILHHFAPLLDPRDHRARKHELTDVVVVALCAVLCDADSWYTIEEFGHAKKDFFARFLKLPNGIPSHDTFNRVFAALNPIAFQNCFTAWINSLADRLGFKHLSIDGKSSRGTADKAAGLGCLHFVSIWANEHGITFAQAKVDQKSNEITAIPPLLRLLDLEGCLVSSDAMGCQKEVAEVILDQKGDYLLAVKENQPTLYHDIVALVDKALCSDFAGMRYAELLEHDKGHGRQETRTYTVIYEPKGLSTIDQWAGLRAIVAVSRRRVVDGKESDELSYYISSSTAAIAVLAAGIRGHWGIENKVHWVLDVVFGEDRSRARAGNAGENLAWLRRTALSVLRQDKSGGTIKGKRKRAGWNEAYLEHLLSFLAA